MLIILVSQLNKSCILSISSPYLLITIPSDLLQKAKLMVLVSQTHVPLCSSAEAFHRSFYCGSSYVLLPLSTFTQSLPFLSSGSLPLASQTLNACPKPLVIMLFYNHLTLASRRSNFMHFLVWSLEELCEVQTSDIIGYMILIRKQKCREVKWKLQVHMAKNGRVNTWIPVIWIDNTEFKKFMLGPWMTWLLTPALLLSHLWLWKIP